MKRVIIVSAILVLALLSACGGGTATPASSTTPASTAMPGTPVSVEGGGNYWIITPAQLYSFKTKDFILAYTDTAYISEIPNTDLFLNSATISQSLDKFPTDKNYKIVVYCAVGEKSKVVAATLVQAGYTRVMELDGGLLAWQQQGYITTDTDRVMS